MSEGDPSDGLVEFTQQRAEVLLHQRDLTVVQKQLYDAKTGYCGVDCDLRITDGQSRFDYYRVVAVLA